MSPALPKISCVMVTFNRIVCLKQSVQCYIDQTYLNKELIIVTAGEKAYCQAIQDYLKSLGRMDIKVCFVPAEKSNLGILRNTSLDCASGDIICQWDDDDFQHPFRLKEQLTQMQIQGGDASFLTDHLQFFEYTRQLFWVDWTLGGVIKGKMQQMPATLMMYKDSRFRYTDRQGGGEDSEFRDKLVEQINVSNLHNLGHLFVYRYHGQNILSEEHHRRIASFAVSADFLHKQIPFFNHYIKYYPLPRPFKFEDAYGNIISSFC